MRSKTNGSAHGNGNGANGAHRPNGNGSASAGIVAERPALRGIWSEHRPTIGNEQKTILVTGGAGFIGSNFVRYLYRNYPTYRLLVVDNLTYAGSVGNFPVGALDSNRYKFWYGNVCNGELIDTLVSQSDIVVHLAAESHVTRSIFDNRLFFETDVIGTQTVANAVLKHRDRVERFIHVSTSEVFGTAMSERMDELHPLNPMSPYAAAKCGADRLVYSYWTTYKIPVIIVRPFNNYGPSQHIEKAIPRFITSCLLGEPVTVHGDGSAARDWLYVEDHCRALDLLLRADAKDVVGEVINVGTGRHISVLDVAMAVCEATGTSPSAIKLIGDRPGQVDRHTCDADKARRLLGWEATTPFAVGLERTIRWYRDHESWWRPQMWLRNVPVTSAVGAVEMH